MVLQWFDQRRLPFLLGLRLAGRVVLGAFLGGAVFFLLRKFLPKVVSVLTPLAYGAMIGTLDNTPDTECSPSMTLFQKSGLSLAGTLTGISRAI